MNTASQDHARSAVAAQGTSSLAPRHTPGPWVYINSKPEGAPSWMSVQKFVKSLSAVVENDRGPSYARCILEDEDYPEKDADGALVAAAPDLLDGLAGLCAAVEGPDEVGGPNWTERVRHNLKIARAAIRKALSDGSEARTGGED